MEKLRVLASSWLLATFGGIGYVFLKDNNIKVFDATLNDPLLDKMLLSLLISFTGMLGISFLWFLDSRVYRSLFASTFLEALHLEQKSIYLIQIRHQIAKNTRTNNNGVVKFISLYYLIMILFLSFISLFFIIYTCTSLGDNCPLIILIPFIILIYFEIYRAFKHNSNANWVKIKHNNKRYVHID